MKGNWYYIKAVKTMRELSYVLWRTNGKENLKTPLSDKMSREIFLSCLAYKFLILKQISMKFGSFYPFIVVNYW